MKSIFLISFIKKTLIGIVITVCVFLFYSFTANYIFTNQIFLSCTGPMKESTYNVFFEKYGYPDNNKDIQYIKTLSLIIVKEKIPFNDAYTSIATGEDFFSSTPKESETFVISGKSIHAVRYFESENRKYLSNTEINFDGITKIYVLKKSSRKFSKDTQLLESATDSNFNGTCTETKPI